MGRASPSGVPNATSCLKWANLREALALDLLQAMGYTRKSAHLELAKRIARDEPLPRRIAC